MLVGYIGGGDAAATSRRGALRSSVRSIYYIEGADKKQMAGSGKEGRKKGQIMSQRTSSSDRRYYYNGP